MESVSFGFGVGAEVCLCVFTIEVMCVWAVDVAGAS